MAVASGSPTCRAPQEEFDAQECQGAQAPKKAEVGRRQRRRRKEELKTPEQRKLAAAKRKVAHIERKLREAQVVVVHLEAACAEASKAKAPPKPAKAHAEASKALAAAIEATQSTPAASPEATAALAVAVAQAEGTGAKTFLPQAKRRMSAIQQRMTFSEPVRKEAAQQPDISQCAESGLTLVAPAVTQQPSQRRQSLLQNINSRKSGVQLEACDKAFKRKDCDDEEASAPEALKRLRPAKVHGILAVGTEAVLQGLQAAATLNGERCKVISYDRATGRYTVKFENSSEEDKRVRAENLVACSP